MLRNWEEAVARLAETCGDRPLFRPDRIRINPRDISHFLGKHQPAGGPALSLRRLRVTWLVHHLNAGTPIPVLAEAAGVERSQLAHYVDFIHHPGPDQARRWLREADPR